MVNGLNNEILDVEILGTSQHAAHKVVGKISWSKVPGIVYIDVPEGSHDKYITVLKVKLNGKLSLYRGKGGL